MADRGCVGERNLNIIIVDDEIMICNSIEKYIYNYYESYEKNHNVNIIKFDNECKLFDYIENGNKANVIFMDIRLKRLNGIDIATKLQGYDNSLKIVFITGYIEYAKDIFRAKPVYFLLKPIKQNDINDVLDRIELDYLENERELLSFKTDNVIHCISKKDIYYIEAEGRNVNIHTRDKQYKANYKISDIYHQVKENMEMCHRSFIVNLDKIDTINKYEVILISGQSLPLSRRRKDDIEKRIIM